MSLTVKSLPDTLPRVLAVVVRYNMAPADSKTIQGLAQAFAAAPELASRMDLLVWDNSGSPLREGELPFGCDYVFMPRNLGIAGAFNGALEIAGRAGYDWLLLLDQDTQVTAGFLSTMLRHVAGQDGAADIGAVAGSVEVKGFVVSPRQYLFNRHRPYPAGESGVAGGMAFAINSGTMLRVRALRDVGGYSYAFWLDYSDYYVFHQLYLRGWKVWRAGDACLEHEMSVMDYDRLMSLPRYANFLAAESAYNDIYKGRLENVVQNLRLLLRVGKQRVKWSNRAFSRMTLRQLVVRLTSSRGRRIAKWNEAAAARTPAGPVLEQVEAFVRFEAQPRTLE